MQKEMSEFVRCSKSMVSLVHQARTRMVPLFLQQHFFSSFKINFTDPNVIASCDGPLGRCGRATEYRIRQLYRR